MLQLTSEYMHIDPREKRKFQYFESATVCHLDESTLFDDKVSVLECSHFSLSVYF